MNKLLHLFAALLLTGSAYAQSQLFVEENVLEGTFIPQISSFNNDGEVTSNISHIAITNYNLERGSLYNAGFSGNEFYLKAYDHNYNLIVDKTVKFSLPNGYSKITMGYYTNQLTNDEADYYLAVVVKDGPSGSGSKDWAQLVVFDRNGKVVQTLCSAEMQLSPYTALYNVDGVYRLVVHEYNMSEPARRTHVYRLQTKRGSSSIRLMNLDPNAPATYNLDGTPATAKQTGVQILLNEQGEPMKILKH